MPDATGSKEASCLTAIEDMPKPSETLQLNHANITGHWGLLTKSTDSSERKSCEFNANGSLKCHVVEHGCTQNGWCEAHTFGTSGKWKIEGRSLLIGEQPGWRNASEEPLIMVDYQVIALTDRFMVIKAKSGAQQVWNKNNSCGADEI